MKKRICKDCGREFVISDSEEKFFKDKNLELPKRCSECRKKKRNYKNSKTSNVNEDRSFNKIDNESTQIKEQVNNNGSSKKSLKGIIAAALVVVLTFLGWHFDFGQDLFNKIATENVHQESSVLTFRNSTLLDEHFEKHGKEFNYATKEEYEKRAAEVVNSSDSLHKTEKEDGDDIYYNESKNEIVFVSKDGYIRTYFKPKDGNSYYNRQ